MSLTRAFLSRNGTKRGFTISKPFQDLVTLEIESEEPHLRDVDDGESDVDEIARAPHQDCWSKMLPELLGEIIKRVESSEDQWPVRKNVVACACVCKRWRDITRGIVRSPLLSGKITFPSSLKQLRVLGKGFYVKLYGTKEDVGNWRVGFVPIEAGQPGFTRKVPPEVNAEVNSLGRTQIFGKFESCGGGRGTDKSQVVTGCQSGKLFTMRSREGPCVLEVHASFETALTDKGKFLLAARRFRCGAHFEYIISLDADDLSQGSNAYVGNSDFLGTKFTIYDSRPPYSGAKPSSSRASRRFASKQISPQVPAGNFEIGQVSYKFNLLKSRGPRRMLCMLQCPWTREATSGESPKNSPEIQSTAAAGCMVLKNKAPRWHDHLQCWCLNFHGRVTVASVKNFQLVAAIDPSQPGGKGDEETVLLQFGKVADNVFTMDYRQPLSAFQAFAICLTSFGTKLACE
ncbi:hypothetical protein HHK36_005136 [Tetracentron sinense]|uniref:Tubby-like F-box protein n=1 Tax=Tetracentron sinense TaxID=13715 RepID=A0A834ZKA5_TETSI|nr:hypothetical protein HHK36_005136 [Tetracentron sinense]